MKGTPWEIPAIEEEHFIVATFQKVISIVAGESIQWVWVDVACIDQRGNEQTAVEVGQQASIFKQAYRPFVWLSRLNTASLAAAVNDAKEHGLNLRDIVDRPFAHRHNVPHTISRLRDALSCIFSDPWFSSLWTLQEVVLRNDAILLSTEGNPVAWETSPQLQYTFLTMFINHCQNVYDDLQKIEKCFLRGTITTYERTPGGNDVVVAILRDMKEHILQAGFYYLFSDNLNVQYGTARYRITSRPVDRVYAIMQIYNLCVGKSARPDKNPGLDELKDEFAAAINHHCIILGQIFLHTDSPDLGKTWRITEFSTIPDKLMDYKDPNRLGTMLTSYLVGCVSQASVVS